MKKKKDTELHILLIIFLVIVIIILFVLTFGKLGSGSILNIPDEFKDDKEKAKLRHKRLEEHIKNQEDLKTKLAKIFRRVYFGVRVGLVLLWFGIMSGLVAFGFIKNLGDFLNYSEASIIVIVVMNFITFGTISNLHNYLSLIRTKTENLIYGKYIKIDLKIEGHKEELKKLGEKFKE